MKKVRTIGFLKVSITNRGIYTLSLFALAVVLAILVYAIAPGSPLSPGQTPNPGHPPSELGIPSPCSSGQFLEYNGTGWVCGGTWTENGTNIYNSNIGNIGIGTTNPTAKLEVNGKIIMGNQTVSSDPADTVATKGYVDNKSSGLGRTSCAWTPWFRRENGNSPQYAPSGDYVAGIDYQATTGGNDGIIRFYYCSA